MKKLLNTDKHYGPLTIASWHKSFSLCLESDKRDGEPTGKAYILATSFGRAIRLRVFGWLCPAWKERWVECNWDAETVKRLGRSGYWKAHPRKFGFSLSDMGNGYDFLQVFYGASTHDRSTDKTWCQHLPWKQWDHVRHSLYTPTGEHFYTEDRNADFQEFFAKQDACPKQSFRLRDYDGEMVTAECQVEEREWCKGSGWFKWLRWFYQPKVVRSLDIRFSTGVGTEKGSWKGGMIGHGIEMLPGETPTQAMERYCATQHNGRGGTKFKLEFIGTHPNP